MGSRSIQRCVPTLSAGFAALTLLGCAPRSPSSVETGAATPSAASKPKSSSATVTDANGRSMAELFQGKFPGVQVFQAPGGGIQIRIRNAGTLNGGGDPLYVLDGVPLQNSADGLVFIDPSDIAKIEVLKDVGSTSLYGVRGANGVVKITTKR